MNKSKFLKRPLAALLAILMVVALVPMSAFAADDDTTAPAAPEYTVVVNNREAAFKDGGFDATVYSTYILSVALYGLPEGVKVDLLTKNGNVVPLTSTTAVDLKQEATLVSETERTSLYNITLRETKGGESKEYTLAVTVENVVPVDNVDIKSVRAEEGDVIDSIIGKDEITLILPLGYTKDDVKTENAADLTAAAFVPANYNATVTLAGDEGSITVKAADNSSKTYKINYTHETGFTSFTVPNQVGETEMSDDGLTISIKVPKGSDLTKIVPTWTTAENVREVRSKNAHVAPTQGAAATKTRELTSAITKTQGIYGVRSGRGEYDFTSNPITFFVETKATSEMNPATAAAVQVSVTKTDKYVGTGIKNFTVTVKKENGVKVPLATIYNVTANNTVYLPAGYSFLAEDEIEVEVNVDEAAVPTVVSQNNPAVIRDDTNAAANKYVFKNVRTNGRMFTMQVKAEDENVAPANYRVNLIAASSSQADLSNNSGLRFQIGGDDGSSMAATFDRQNVTDGQYDMTIKVPYGTLKKAVAGYACSINGAGSNDAIVDIYQGGVSGNTATADFSKIDKTALASLVSSDTTLIADDTWNGAKVGLQFSDSANKKVQFVLFKSSTEKKLLGNAKTPSNVHEGKQEDGINNNTTITFGGGVGNVVLNYGNGTWTYEDYLFHDGTNAWKKFVRDEDANLPVLYADDSEAIRIIDTGLICNISENPYKVDNTNTWDFGKQAVYALVSPGASAYYNWNNEDGTGNVKPIQSSITTFGDIWNNCAVAYPGTKGVISIHVEQNETKKDYRIKLVEEDPRTGNKIIEPATIADDNVIGEGKEFVGTPVEKGGNDSLLKVGVDYEWKNTAASIPTTTYIYNGLKISDGAKAYIVAGASSGSYKLVEVKTDGDTTNEATSTYGSLNNKKIKAQSDVEALDVATSSDIVDNGRTPVVKSLKEKIYVISEAEYARLTASGNADAAFVTSTTLADADLTKLASYAHVYNVYYERGTANNQAQLLTVGSSTPGVRATLDYTKTVNVRVPNSFNWSTYRDNGECDFTIDFTVSDGASLSDNAYGTWATGKTNFFVKDSELYVFDKLTGRKTQITNKGKYEPQAAMLTVTSQNGKVTNTYPFRLTIAQPESNNKLKKVVVGETEAAINGSDVTVTLPAGSELKAQDVFITPDSDVATVQNDKGEAFDSTVKHDLSEPMKFTITAEDGTKAEYTLTATVGGDVPGPDGKPSDKYDLSDVYSGHLEDVKKAIDMGLMSGTGAAGKFNPKGKIARQDFALIIARADMKAENPDAEDIDALLREKYADAEEAFNDISGLNDTQKAAVAHCKENGIISGNGKGGFDPKGDVTRQHAAVMIAGWCGLEHDDTANTNNIKDWNNVASWAKPYVNAVYKAGLMSGTGSDNFSPEKILERQQAATVLVGAYEKKNAEVE